MKTHASYMLRGLASRVSSGNPTWQPINSENKEFAEIRDNPDGSRAQQEARDGRVAWRMQKCYGREPYPRNPQYAHDYSGSSGRNGISVVLRYSFLFQKWRSNWPNPDWQISGLADIAAGAFRA